jgi:hypothetical protein
MLEYWQRNNTHFIAKYTRISKYHMKVSTAVLAVVVEVKSTIRAWMCLTSQNVTRRASAAEVCLSHTCSLLSLLYLSNRVHLTLFNQIFLPPTYSPALIYFGRERYWWVTCNYPTVLSQKNRNRNRKSTTYAFCWLKSVLHEEKRREQENQNVGR